MKNVSELSNFEILSEIKDIIYSMPIFFEFERKKILDEASKKGREELIVLYQEAIVMKQNFEANKDEIMKNVSSASKNLQIAYMDYQNALAKYNISQKELIDNDEPDLDKMLEDIF